MRTLLPDVDGARVAELGSGTGRVSAILAELGAAVVALDTSIAMHRAASQTMGGVGAGWHPACASAYQLPLQSHSLRGIIAINVFSHIRDLGEVLSECSRVLRPDGWLLFNYPNLRGWYWPAALAVNRRQRALALDVYTHWRTRRSVSRHLADAGLTTTAQAGMTHAPRPLDGTLLTSVFRSLDRLSAAPGLKHLSTIQFVLAHNGPTSDTRDPTDCV